MNFLVEMKVANPEGAKRFTCLDNEMIDLHTSLEDLWIDCDADEHEEREQEREDAERADISKIEKMRRMRWKRRMSKTNGSGKSAELTTSCRLDGLSIILAEVHYAPQEKLGSFEPCRLCGPFDRK